ncbi:hypothetical protein CAOG_04784 [Capsaspora owczarzaki ATCC 30864]|uniref:Uncharacterized protein n=1 Tax=Capsaspora owczarzaki (strain ATCC 30864) TaxID=595528 RepID=A0A0D2VSL4_CAPO3|nr:hypothetical protein CAOG_04784 [Capsaspora owczarzaki ATCC 30864]KJE94092.1 hypothetical protein CAOG_004784 [Capsaspora owczarzaki ATCC 30864]|eukprot:XP_004347535.1 hypothetical protein CAOG_04784 [Capsaspora owczarzaki ATCC 30864]
MASPGRASRTKFSEDAMLISLASEAEKRLDAKRKQRKEAKAAVMQRQESLQRKEAQKLNATFREKAEVEKTIMESRMNVLLSGGKADAGLSVGTDIVQTVAGEKLVSLRQQLDQALQSKTMVESSKSTLRFAIEDLKDRLEEREEELSQALIDLKMYRQKYQQEEGARLLMEKNAEEYSKEVDRMREQVLPLSQEIETQKQANAELQERLASLGDVQSSSSKVSEKLDATLKELAESRAETAAAKDSNKRFEQEVDRLREQLKTMGEKSKGSEEANKLRTQLEDEQLAKGRLERQVTKMQPRIDQLEKDLTESEAQLSDLKAEKRKTQREQRQMQTQITELQTELNVLKATMKK